MDEPAALGNCIFGYISLTFWAAIKNETKMKNQKKKEAKGREGKGKCNWRGKRRRKRPRLANYEDLDKRLILLGQARDQARPERGIVWSVRFIFFVSPHVFPFILWCPL